MGECQLSLRPCFRGRAPKAVRVCTRIVVVEAGLFTHFFLFFQLFEFLENLGIDEIGDVVTVPNLGNGVVPFFRVLDAGMKRKRERGRKK